MAQIVAVRLTFCIFCMLQNAIFPSVDRGGWKYGSENSYLTDG